METDTPVYVSAGHNQYGVIRKVIKNALPASEGKIDTSSKEKTGMQYEVRLSTTLENVVVDPSDLKRMISIQLRIHSLKGADS